MKTSISKTIKKYFDQFRITEPDVIIIFNVFADFSPLPSEQVSAINSLLDGAYRTKHDLLIFQIKIHEHHLNLCLIIK